MTEFKVGYSLGSIGRIVVVEPDRIRIAPHDGCHHFWLSTVRAADYLLHGSPRGF